MGHIQIWRYFSLIVKYKNILMTFTIGTFQSHCKSEHNQVKWNKITRDMWKPDSVFFIHKIAHYLNDFLKFSFLIRFIIKEKWTHLAQKNSQPGSKINIIFEHNIMRVYRPFYHKKDFKNIWFDLSIKTVLCI